MPRRNPQLLFGCTCQMPCKVLAPSEMKDGPRIAVLPSSVSFAAGSSAAELAASGKLACQGALSLDIAPFEFSEGLELLSAARPLTATALPDLLPKRLGLLLLLMLLLLGVAFMP